MGDEIELDYFKDRLKGKDIEHLKVLKTETKEYVGGYFRRHHIQQGGHRGCGKNGVAFLIKTVKEGGNADVKHEHN